MKVYSFRVIWHRINDRRSLRSLFSKGTIESILGKDSSAPLIHHDQSDVESLIQSWVFPKEYNLSYS